MTIQPDSLARRPLGYGGWYSRFVAVMKRLLPVVALALVLLTALWPEMQNSLNRLRILVPRLDLSAARDLKMVNARYSGVDKLHRPFTVTADVARQTPDHGDLLSLEGPKADMTMSNGAWIALTSQTGVYKTQSQLLDLFGDVRLYHDRGYELSTDSAHVDMNAGTAAGEDPVHGQGMFGRITSEGFRLFDHGQVIVFTGRAKLHMLPQRGVAAAAR